MPIAEAIALAGLEWVASTVIKDLFKKSISYLGTDIAKDLEDLETTLLPLFQLTIEAAQNSPPNHKAVLTKWLARMKNAYFDAETILHELEYDRLERKAKGEDNKMLVRFSSNPIIKPFIKTASLLSEKKLLQRLKKLKKVAAEAETFRSLLNIKKTESLQNAGNNHFVTSALLGKADKVFGRDRDRDDIINFLLDKQGDGVGDCYLVVGYLMYNFNLLTDKFFGRERDRYGGRYSVIAITGMGGIGKTALARYVYNDERVEKHFAVRMWLDFSQNLDIIERTKEMIGCALPSEKEYHNQRNLSVLQTKLIETLPESGNIMIVLDNVCYDNNDSEETDNQWENLLKPFTNFGGSCKIMITSRSRVFPIALPPEKLIKLSYLAPHDFKSVVRHYAIDGLQDNPQLMNGLSDMRCIVDQIANKMSKLPLGAKIVGNQLRKYPNITFWLDTLQNVQLKDTTDILLWSFYRFNVQLQRCFLFCSIFPKGTRFDLDTLMPYWVALDFIQPSNDNRSVEDIGLGYFEIMVANSIFDLVDKKYIMQESFYNLAVKLSAEDCFTVTNDNLKENLFTKREIPPTVQHVYVEALNNDNLKENISRVGTLRNLRTLILENPFIDDVFKIIPKKSKKKFRNLRVLDVWSRGYKTMPEVVGDFKNLRLLNFGMSSIEELPNSVLQLYHLQFLKLPQSVKTLPKELCNLIKLRHIKMFNNDGVQVNTLPQVPYLSKLTSLQGLDEFHVRKEGGYEMKQLGSLKEIGGSLRIVNLDNVRDKNEAVEARLIDKTKLKSLELVWTELTEIDKPDRYRSTRVGLEIEVIESLQPPANLEYLTVDGYRGSTYPNWLEEEGSFIKYIKSVRFYNCNALTNLPKRFHHLCHCSELILKNLGALSEISTFPENLVSLSIINCGVLTFVCENELQENEIQSIFQRLWRHGKRFKQAGSENYCQKQLEHIKSAPHGKSSAWGSASKLSTNVNVNKKIIRNKLKLPSMLRVLHLEYCGVSDGVLSDCLRGMTTLEELHVSGISITTLPPTQVLVSLQSLRVVEIKECRDLRSLGDLHALSRLESFLVKGTLYLEMQPWQLPTLQSFTIINCGDPQVFLNGHLPSLQNVVIKNCLVPSSLLFCHLTNLKSLMLESCSGLKKIEGLESCRFINTLQLLDLPKLKSVSDSWRGCQEELIISSPMMLKTLLSWQHFAAPKFLGITNCQEEEISFEKHEHLRSIKTLIFTNCKTKNLPKSLSDFSTLEFIDFIDCPQISELPQLPDSVQRITIRGCPELPKRCQQNKGRDWHKIQHIKDRWIE